MSDIPLSGCTPLPRSEGQFPLPFIRKQGALLARNAIGELRILTNRPADRELRRLLDPLLPAGTPYLEADPAEMVLWLGRQLNGTLPGTSPRSPDRCRLETTEERAPAVNLLNGLLIEGIRSGASDIHIGTGAVRYRIDGILCRGIVLSPDQKRPVISRLKVLAGLNLSETRRPQEGRLSADLHGKTWDFRISILPSVEGETATLRLFNRKETPPALEDLGFSVEEETLLRRLFHSVSGLILVTGPTGSGKSTTLNALISLADPSQRKIITLEDPVEFVRPEITQIPVREERGMDYASLLARVLRQDPDIIMVGEIRHARTARLAIRAALTGHLVLSTLHTRDTLSAPVRLRNLGIPEELLQEVLQGITAQRLVRKKEGGRIPVSEFLFPGEIRPAVTLAERGKLLWERGIITREEWSRLPEASC